MSEERGHKRRATSAVTRAEEDIRRGDLGAARQRLASYLGTRGYDPELLDRIGRISHDMRDIAQAGRYWFLATASGPDIERAIAAFLRNAGHDPAIIASQLPRHALLDNVDAYPPSVQPRIHGAGLDTELVRVARHRRLATHTGDSSPWLLVPCLLFVLGLTVVVLVGLTTIGAWLFGE